MEGQIAAGLRVGRQNSALFAREEWNSALGPGSLCRLFPNFRRLKS